MEVQEGKQRIPSLFYLKIQLNSRRYMIMLDYEMFKEVLEKMLSNFILEKYQGYQVKIVKRHKVNRVIDMMEIISEDDTKRAAFPSFPTRPFYEFYLECGNLQRIFQSITEKLTKEMEKCPSILEKMDLGKAGENIILTLVNTKQNKELLQSVPHRKWHDLSIVYRWIIGKCEDGFGNTLVNHMLADRIGMDEDSLYKAALRNTQRMFPARIDTMNDLMGKLLLAGVISEEETELINFLNSNILAEHSMYIISNSDNTFGAACILYENLLHGLAEKVGSDLYIMPSSIHEMIVVDASGDPDELARMVRDINYNLVELEEQLSNQVYHYDRSSRRVTLASDTLYKRLENGTK